MKVELVSELYDLHWRQTIIFLGLNLYVEITWAKIDYRIVDVDLQGHWRSAEVYSGLKKSFFKDKQKNLKCKKKFFIENV